jgi:formylglycine-generating enzyme required for sulfatase activity
MKLLLPSSSFTVWLSLLLLAACRSASTATPASAILGDTWTRAADGMVMVYVPAGEFEMGSTEGRDDEQPVHTVALDGFWIDRTEVSNAQYLRCVEAGACSPPPESGSYTRDPYYGNSTYEDYPVIFVSWYEAADYCTWAGGAAADGGAVGARRAGERWTHVPVGGQRAGLQQGQLPGCRWSLCGRYKRRGLLPGGSQLVRRARYDRQRVGVGGGLVRVLSL